MGAHEEQQAFEAAFAYAEGQAPENVVRHYAGGVLVAVEIGRPSGVLQITPDSWDALVTAAEYGQFIKDAED